MAPLLHCTLKHARIPRPPIWLMRQAGRYLPEYQALRRKAPDFLNFATRPTLLPRRHCSLSGALASTPRSCSPTSSVVPDALGCRVWFADGGGPS